MPNVAPAVMWCHITHIVLFTTSGALVPHVRICEGWQVTAIPTATKQLAWLPRKAPPEPSPGGAGKGLTCGRETGSDHHRKHQGGNGVLHSGHGSDFLPHQMNPFGTGGFNT